MSYTYSAGHFTVGNMLRCSAIIIVLVILPALLLYLLVICAKFGHFVKMTTSFEWDRKCWIALNNSPIKNRLHVKLNSNVYKVIGDLISIFDEIYSSFYCCFGSWKLIESCNSTSLTLLMKKWVRLNSWWIEHFNTL